MTFMKPKSCKYCGHVASRLSTIARAQGFRKDGHPKASTRLGHGAAQATAATWQTTATAYIRADGSGHVIVRRNGTTVHHFHFGAE